MNGTLIDRASVMVEKLVLHRNFILFIFCSVFCYVQNISVTDVNCRELASRYRLSPVMSGRRKKEKSKTTNHRE